MKKIFVTFFIILILFSNQLSAKQACILKDEITLSTNVKIKKTKILKEYSEDLKNRQRKCVSKFKIKTDSWKTLTGEYIYGTNISEDEACFQARKTAVQTYLRNNFEKLVTNVQVINCSDVVEKKKAIAINVPENITLPLFLFNILLTASSKDLLIVFFNFFIALVSSSITFFVSSFPLIELDVAGDNTELTFATDAANF